LRGAAKEKAPDPEAAMKPVEIAYLGPRGTYSHLVAEKRYGRRAKLVDLPTVTEVCAFVSRHPLRHGIVPIENSSGGVIYETIDILLDGKPRVHIDEELTLDVKLALLGHRDMRIKTVYSHFAPLEHCDVWLKRHLPGAERREVASTAAAAMHSVLERTAAAIGNRRLADIYGLDVLRYPLAAAVPNVTMFLAVSGRRTDLARKRKTTLAVRLPNVPGALCTFLEAFRDEAVNLSRLLSRPLRGCPREYAFLVDVEGGTGDVRVRRALRAARAAAARLRIVGSYPCRPPYKS
jgi:prephenate dehydratase